MRNIVIGTRQSALALWQANFILNELQKKYASEINVSLKKIVTKGDKILDVPLAKIGGKGLFMKELEQELFDKKIDLAVHSLKDIPAQLDEKFLLAAITKRTDVGDAFVSEKFSCFADLPKNARVGTSSLRRQAQLLSVRPDLKIENLRGNVNTRLKKLDAGEFDAVILAVAGLKRLGFEHRIREILPQKICLPAVGQGALAIEIRKDDDELKKMISFLNDEETFCCTKAERAFLSEMNGGCQIPAGVFAKLHGETICLEGMIASPDGEKLLREKILGKKNEAEQLGKTLAQKLLAQGGKEILKNLGLF